MDKPFIHNGYEFGEFRVDVVNRMLYRQGEAVQLAPKAVETLLALIEHRGQIVSKATLLDVVWPETAVEESNLFLYLSVLRKTLETQPNGEPWIETLRRRGYRFNGDVREIGHGRETELLTKPEMEEGTQLSPAIPNTIAGVEDAKHSQATAAEPSSGISSRRSVWLAASLAGIVVLAVLAFAIRDQGSRPPISSIAVLPFTNDSGDRELDYLAASMTNTLIGKLVILPNLEVKSNAAVNGRYK